MILSGKIKETLGDWADKWSILKREHWWVLTPMYMESEWKVCHYDNTVTNYGSMSIHWYNLTIFLSPKSESERHPLWYFFNNKLILEY